MEQQQYSTYAAFPQDMSCYQEASHASCDAMSELAIAELQRNRGPFAYRTIGYPACERFQTPTDRTTEHTLQKPFEFMRNACFTKEPGFQNGPWKQQFQCTQQDRLQFDAWTRAKGATIPKMCP